MSETRERIADRVAADPGIHFSELVRELNLAPGQVQYHLRRLDDRVVAADLYGRTHYYPSTVDERDRRVLAALRRETARDALAVLLRRGPTPPATVADELGVARSTLEWHLDRLVAEDLVRKSRDRRGRVTLVLADPDWIGSHLDAVEPSLPERLVDRFDRLLDGLLPE
ncbi:ArsR family transcriptional regulator [Halobacteriales archaeon QH_7_68_42]|nr:MAG: ArsR family transcriptional regulator [Halobacteriales archaeon QH_7_68_42]